ncbi:MAG: filamentous hemagglutinin N-terminal domain-containing protein [Succinivibrio sp.]
MKLFLSFFKYTFMKNLLTHKTIAVVAVIAFMPLKHTCAQIILPTGEKVIYGDAHIEKTNQSMLISSSTNKNVILWDSFSVGSGGSVIFDSNHYLNLVKGNTKSIIEGSVSSLRGGSFALVNPNGIEITKTGHIDSGKVVLSTAKVSENEVESFISTGEFMPKGSGMGKIGINGTITADNLIHLNGGQIIIRDIEDLTLVDSRSVAEDLRLVSSTKRIDVGGRLGITLEETYGLKEEDGLVSHIGKTALSDKTEFLSISDRLDGDYFLTADVDLGYITETIGRSSPFTGSFDGAFNEITYKLEFNPSSSGNNAGLFDSLSGATISNLRINNPEITLNAPYYNQLLGGLSGLVTDSKITNVEVNNLSVKFVRTDDPVVIAGGLFGKVTSVTGNYFDNVSAGFSLATQDILFNSGKHTAGTLIGAVSGETEVHGQAFGKTAYDYGLTNPLKAIGRGSIEGVCDNYDTEDGLYLKTDEHLHLKDFYLPYYVGSDESYDLKNLTPYNYKESLDNPYYSTSSLVDVSCDYIGDIDREGVFNHEYSSYDGRFYFIKDDKASSNVIQTVTVQDSSKVDGKPLIPDNSSGVKDDYNYTLDSGLINWFNSIYGMGFGYLSYTSGNKSFAQYSRDGSIDTENASAYSYSKFLKKKLSKEKTGNIEFITYNQPLTALAHPLFLATAGIDTGKVNGGAKTYIAWNNTSSFWVNS